MPAECYQKTATTVFRGKFFQSPRASLPNSAADFPHIVINLLRPLNPTKYTVFVAGNRNWQIQSVCQNKLAIFQISSAQYPVTAWVAVMCFMAQLRLHTVINYKWSPETDQNMLYLSPYCWPVPNSVARLKILCSVENCGPYQRL